MNVNLPPKLYDIVVGLLLLLLSLSLIPRTVHIFAVRRERECFALDHRPPHPSREAIIHAQKFNYVFMCVMLMADNSESHVVFLHP
jgi:hypothetical protein